MACLELENKGIGMDTLKEDIRLAQMIVANKYFDNKSRYNDTSIIYRGTNECVSSYIKYLINKKRILSVIASGDQILNSILVGSKDIVGFDISRFPKYYLELKIAAIKVLNKEEYIKFFVGDRDELLNVDIYDLIRKEMPSKYRMFWDSLFDYFDPVLINESHLFSTEVVNRKINVRNNIFLQGENYLDLRRMLDKVHITYFNDNIFNLASNIERFNLVNMSSIIHYLGDNFGRKDCHSKYREFLSNIPLFRNGIVLSYLYGTNSYWKEEGIIDRYYSDLELDMVRDEDSVLVYRKK